MQYRHAFANELIEYAKENNKTILIESDITSPARQWFQTYYPKNFINTGIAEQCAIPFAAGLSSKGYTPVYYTMGFCVGLIYNQVKQSLMQNNEECHIVAYNCGAVGLGGQSHNEICDVALMRTIPGMNIYAPYDMKSMKYCFSQMMGCRMSYMRIPAYEIKDLPLPKNPVNPKACIYAFGDTYDIALEAQRDLNFEVSVKPICDLRMSNMPTFEDVPIVTLEDHSVVGGFGEMVSAMYSGRTKVVNIGQYGNQCQNEGENRIKASTVVKIIQDGFLGDKQCLE